MAIGNLDGHIERSGMLRFHVASGGQAGRKELSNKELAVWRKKGKDLVERAVRQETKQEQQQPQSITPSQLNTQRLSHRPTDSIAVQNLSHKSVLVLSSGRKYVHMITYVPASRKFLLQKGATLKGDPTGASS